MGMRVSANLTFGIPVYDYSFCECVAFEDGIREWIYDCTDLEYVNVFNYDYEGFIVSFKTFTKSYDVEAISTKELEVTPYQLEICTNYAKALCRYLDIEYSEPQWYLSSFYG